MKNWKMLFSPDHPAAVLWGFTFLSGILWIIQAAALQNILPLDVVEAIVWGAHRTWGEMKSPPLSGWLACGAFQLGGGRDWTLYLLAQLTVVSSVFFTWKLAKEFLDEYGAAAAALLLYFLLYYMPPAMKFCSHDTQVALLPAMTWFFFRAWRDDHLKDWLLLALFSAAAFLGKYSAGQVMLGFAVVTFATKTGRKRLTGYRPYLAGLVFLLLLGPHLHWLVRHDFLPFRHLNDRIDRGVAWYQCFETLGLYLYPYAALLGVLLLSYFPWKGMKFRRMQWNENLRFLLPVSLIPGSIYLGLSICGHSIVDQWFCYLAYPAGIIAVLLFPFPVDRRCFRNLTVMVWAFFTLLFVITVIDVAFSPRYRIHTAPQSVIESAEKFWQSKTGKPIPAVYGDRWFAGVIEIYSPHHPPACDDGDLCSWELMRARVEQEGMLVVSRSDKFRPAIPELRQPIRFEACTYHYRTIFGKTGKRKLFFGLFPPLRRKK